MNCLVYPSYIVVSALLIQAIMFFQTDAQNERWTKQNLNGFFTSTALLGIFLSIWVLLTTAIVRYTWDQIGGLNG